MSRTLSITTVVFFFAAGMLAQSSVNPPLN
jgi:hypothetical protein